MNKKDYEDFIDNVLMPQLTRETAKKLQESQLDLRQCKWAEGESNIDTDFSKLAGEKAKESFQKMIKLNPIFNQKINIEISNPDIKINFKLSEYQTSIKRKIELKSGYTVKENDVIILGSTIGKLDINIWLIFVLRKNNNEDFEVRYGRYYKGIKVTENELFQDRTPRPKISFNEYQTVEELPDTQLMEKDEAWINKYAESAVYRIINESKSSKNYSWQDDLVIEILRIVLKNDDILRKVLLSLNIDKNTLIERIKHL
ncbi:hypothetical protein [Geminocystis herdmanii]|uniref:hypothetical protein n=1 Tax=Geminocystis herdmanii TaxID=669359 RepID=UPI000365ABBB|nr:hypothetical protein [Geminocystis herdmanii]